MILEIIGGVLLLFLLLILIVVAYLSWTRYASLRGRYGEKAKWAAELQKDGDKEFVKAALAMSPKMRRELAMMADSKDELRDLVVKYYDRATTNDNRNA